MIPNMPASASGRRLRSLGRLWTCVSIAAVMIAVGPSSSSPPLHQLRAIMLPDVKGRIDHMALDREGQRLFIAALGNGSVEVIDLAAGKAAGRISNLKEPQGVGYIAARKQLVVSSGGEGTCRLYDAANLKELAKVDAGPDADNIRIDAKTGLIYIGFDPGLAILEAGPNSLTKRGEIKLAGHAESFQLEQNGARIFINVPDARQVQVVDREKKSVIASWNITEARGNYPMALDEAGHRLFIACRNPAKLLTIDTESGKVVAAIECVGDADDVFFDAATKRILVSGGEGFIDIFTPESNSHFARERIETVRGARTAFFDPESRTLYLAVPHRGDQTAEIRVLTFDG